MNEVEWLGNNQLSLDIWHKKYQINNESFEEWLDRVSGGNSYVKQLIRIRSSCLEEGFLQVEELLTERLLTVIVMLLLLLMII